MTSQNEAGSSQNDAGTCSQIDTNLTRANLASFSCV